jgi:hypothetical protein
MNFDKSGRIVRHDFKEDKFVDKNVPRIALEYRIALDSAISNANVGEFLAPGFVLPDTVLIRDRINGYDDRHWAYQEFLDSQEGQLWQIHRGPLPEGVRSFTEEDERTLKLFRERLKQNMDIRQRANDAAAKVTTFITSTTDGAVAATLYPVLNDVTKTSLEKLVSVQELISSAFLETKVEAVRDELEEMIRSLPPAFTPEAVSILVDNFEMLL